MKRYKKELELPNEKILYFKDNGHIDSGILKSAIDFTGTSGAIYADWWNFVDYSRHILRTPQIHPLSE